MITALRSRLSAGGREAGFTLPELLVALAMGTVLMAGVVVLILGAMKSQPDLTKRAENISEARWMLERLTREIRNGIEIDEATASRVSFRTFVRRTACGSPGTPAASAPAIPCQVAYTCSATLCRRAESAPGTNPGTGTPIFRGIDNADVFSYAPSEEEPTYIEVTLHIPNPSGPADLTVSDGASLRNAVLSQ